MKQEYCQLLLIAGLLLVSLHYGYAKVEKNEWDYHTATKALIR